MRLDQLRVELRPRSPFEAMELGVALVRRHARAIWMPWLLASLPVFVLFNAIGWTFDAVPYAALAMWWCKPLYDRIPLFVVSRAVFGTAPAARDTLVAFARWGWRPMLGYLTWRRPGLARSLFLPIDLLEGGTDPARRRKVIGNAARGVGALLTLTCMAFELALVCAAYALVMLAVPVEFLSESARAVWALVFEAPPRWAQVLVNAVAWLAATAIGPVFVGAGFGLYLDRRTRIEGWDIEIAFRRMRQRLAAVGACLLCASVLVLSTPRDVRADDTTPARAAAPSTPPATRPASKPVASPATTPAATPAAKPTKTTARRARSGPPTLPRVFPRVEQDARFAKAVEGAYADPLLRPVRNETVWERRNPAKARDARGGTGFARWIALVVGAFAEYGLWLLGLLLVVLLASTWRTWWPWLHGIAAVPARDPLPTRSVPHPEADALPDDVPAAARGLWQAGHGRRALALLYRASVAAMATRTGAVLVPGATEAECLRAARALRDDEDRDAFAQMVRVWQHAAYAERLPATDAFEALLLRLGGRFGWAT